MSNYAHLHVHTDYSALDGLSKIEELIQTAKELGQPAIAITDHGSSSGLYEAQELGKKYDFKVLLGEEFYFESVTKKNGHLILIAKNDVGLENLFLLQKLAYDNFYYKPRINMELLRNNHEGLICTTACIANQMNRYILSGEIELAKRHLTDLYEIFGDDLYIELQSSTLDDVINVNKVLLNFSKEFGIKHIITNDVHYVNRKDFEVHEVLLAIQQKVHMDSKKRWKFEVNDYWCKSQEEIEEHMPYLTREQFDNAYDNINEIINKCNAEIKSGNYLPKWEDDSGLTEDEALEAATWSNYVNRIGARKETNDEFAADLNKELKVISEEGYSGYFMIVQEYANWAKENNILIGDGRGSGAGSKVAYTLGITDVNPQKYDLLFERFLSHGREPDFDIDFSDIDAVFKHLQDRYGKDNVARVGAFNRFTCKSALRKVMACFGFAQSDISRIVGLLPNRLSFTLKEAMEESQTLCDWFKANERIYDCVEKLEGVLSHMSTHAGGVIICQDLIKKLPIITDSSDRSKMIVAFDKHIISDLGHYKFDILGLKSLTLLKDILDNIDEKIDWHNIDFEDENVYKMLSSGDTLGVFQLTEQSDAVQQQQPNCFEDLIAINALIRPGVGDWNEYIRRRNEKDSGGYELDFMRSTNGMLVYQDQYLLLANYYAGWDIAYSDKHIRKNKRIKEDVELNEKFINDGRAKSFDVNDLSIIWGDICDVVAGGYGFNRAHSTSYARLSYQTAWLKYYYPKQFYAGYLTQNFDDTTEIQRTQIELNKLGIKLLPPDLNESTDKFEVVEDGILFPLTSIKGVGGSVFTEINRMKPIKSFDDFMERRIRKFVKKTALWALIKAGAFDFDESNRTNMLLDCDYDKELAQDFAYEKEVLGIYLSDSPLENYLPIKIEGLKNDDKIIGVIQVQDVTIVNDKRGNEMAFFTAMARNTVLRCIVFSSMWGKLKKEIEVNKILLIEGKLSNNSILINKAEQVE